LRHRSAARFDASVPDQRRIHVLELRSVQGTGGGPEKTILLGAARANGAAFDVVVCYVRDRRDEVFRLDQRAATMGVNYVEVVERHSFDVRVWRQLVTAVRDRHIDIVHSHEYKTDLLALLLARTTGIVPVATAHGWSGHSARERFLYYPIDKRLLARFPRVVAVSSVIQNELIRTGTRRDRITLLLNAIDPDAYARVPGRGPLVRQAFGWRQEHFVIGAVGRLERVKRFDLLLEAVAPIVGAHSRLQLAIVGDGSLREDLAALAARLGIAEHCRFLGHRDDIVDLHHAFDLLVQASESEGTPNAVLEAMAMETPVVATDVGGTRELAADRIHAIIVPRHDVASLRAAIKDVIADPAGARTRAVAARQRIEQDLSFAARTRKLEALYAELAPRARVPHA
jgi:glycosyltransferase involved in cell wall biosynthesis